MSRPAPSPSPGSSPDPDPSASTNPHPEADPNPKVGFKCGDLDNDGFVDVVMALDNDADSLVDVIEIVWGNGDKTFDTPTTVSDPTNGCSPITVVDYDAGAPPSRADGSLIWCARTMPSEYMNAERLSRWQPRSGLPGCCLRGRWQPRLHSCQHWHRLPEARDLVAELDPG